MPSVVYEQSERIVTITMSRPEAMNSIDPETHQALIEAWTRFRDDDDAWVAILTGAGEKSFSAGADLKKMIPAAFGRKGGGRGHNVEYLRRTLAHMHEIGVRDPHLDWVLARAQVLRLRMRRS